MRLTVNYTILDILHNEHMITAEKGITEEDLQFVKKIINKLVPYNCIFLTDENGYFLRMYYGNFEDREMSRSRVYKLVKEVLENGLNEYVGA